VEHFKFNLDAFRIMQADVDLYVTVMRAIDLLSYAKIDRWDEDNPMGYQRPLLERRVAKAANYLLFEDKVFPTSVLVNIRGRVDFFPVSRIGKIGEYGVLRIPEGSLPFWIIDGQHRLMAIALAARENPKYESYPVPVTVLSLPDRYSEMRVFYVVNSRQKSVPTALAQRHLKLSVSIKGLDEVRRYEAKRKVMAAIATSIVDFLRSDPGSPWYGKILLPSEKRKKHLISQTSLADSIGILLMKLPSEDFDTNKLDECLSRISSLLKDYWNSIKDLFPEAFEIPEDYTIQKTVGCYVFHLLFPHIYPLLKRGGDFSKNNMKKILMKTFKNFTKATGIEINSEFWNRWTGNPLATGTGMKTVKKLANLLIDSIPPDL
jgi:DGQHR domain-containing protein